MKKDLRDEYTSQICAVCITSAVNTGIDLIDLKKELKHCSVCKITIHASCDPFKTVTTSVGRVVSAIDTSVGESSVGETITEVPPVQETSVGELETETAEWKCHPCSSDDGGDPRCQYCPRIG